MNLTKTQAEFLLRLTRTHLLPALRKNYDTALDMSDWVPWRESSIDARRKELIEAQELERELRRVVNLADYY